MRRELRPGGLALVLGALLCTSVVRDADAQTYSVEIRPELNGLDVGIEQIPQASMLIIELTNNESARVRCVLNFDASPQTPRRSTRTLNPGETISSVFRAQRRWFRVTVDVNCRPAS